MPEIVMPRLSDSMEEGVILSWFKSEGDEIAVGEEIVEIETDKASMTYESDLSGTLTKIVAGEGETIPVGQQIAMVGEEAEAADGPEAAQGGADIKENEGDETGKADEAGKAEDTDEADETGKGAADSSSAPAVSAVAGDGGRIKASPVARRIAEERGVDLSAVDGSGPGGRIIRKDVEAAEPGGREAPAAEPDGRAATRKLEERQAAQGDQLSAKGEVETVDPDRRQQTIARRMAESKAVAPHFYLTTEVDMSACVEGRKRLSSSAPEGATIPSFNDMIVKASALALREHPKANASYRDGHFEYHSRVNVGIAVATEGSLVVPTVFDADRAGLREIATESRRLAAAVRDGSITPPDLSGATFTVSNLGMYGITEFDAVINLPQAAILAVGTITERPVVRDGEITTAHIMKMTLSCDHRILYGAEGAEFLARIRELLEEPLSLAL